MRPTTSRGHSTFLKYTLFLSVSCMLKIDFNFDILILLTDFTSLYFTDVIYIFIVILVNLSFVNISSHV